MPQQVPYFDATGNGEIVTDSLFVTPDGHLIFGHAYTARQMRLRHGAEAGETLALPLVRVTIEVIGEGDL